MNCESTKEKLVDLFNNQVSASERAAMETHMSTCPDCQQELQTVSQIWHAMGTITVPTPSKAMHTKFYTMLDTYKETVEAEQQRPFNNFVHWLQELLTPKMGFRIAYSLLLISMGVAAGYFFNSQRTPAVAYQQKIETLSSEMLEMKRMMMLSLLENPSASERIRAVSYTDEIGHVNNQITEALLTTLNQDPNVNVRLVTLEALVKYAKDPVVREGLVQSIAQQDSPLVQTAIADVMVKLQEKKSVKSLQQLLKKEDLNETVKSKIEESLQKLI